MNTGKKMDRRMQLYNELFAGRKSDYVGEAPCFSDIKQDFDKNYEYMETLDVLTDREKQILRLRVYGGLSQKEAGKWLNISDSRVHHFEYKAKLKLIRNEGMLILFVLGIDEYTSYLVSKKVAIFKDGKVDDLDLIEQDICVLKRAGIFTISDLISMSEKDLLNCRNIGTKRIESIRKALEKHYLSLRGED